MPGAEIVVNASPAPSDNPKSVTFDGTNYLVVWNDEVGGKGTETWDCFGQLVSTGRRCCHFLGRGWAAK